MKKLCIYVCLLCLLCGCQTLNEEIKDDASKAKETMVTASFTQSEFQAFMNDVEENRIPNTILFHDQLQKANDVSFDREAYMEALQYVMSTESTYNTVNSFHSDELKEDVTILFQLLKTLYGPYPFIGEESFQNAQQNICSELDIKSSFTLSEFGAFVRKHLSFLRDMHFMINYEHLSYESDIFPTYYKEQNISYVDTTFVKKDGNFYRIGYDSKIVSIHGDVDLQNYLRPVFMLDGTITYQLFISNHDLKQEVVIEFEDHTTLPLSIEQCVNQGGLMTYSEFQSIEDIPYVHLMGMPYEKDGGNFEEVANKFLEMADTFKDSPYAILDLRGNGGGNAAISYEWSYRFSGRKLSGFGTHVLRMPYEDDDANAIGEQTSLSMQKMHTYADYEMYIDGTYVDDGDDELFDNDTLLFVLQDENSASAAEMLIDQLHSLRNVIFIGMPSEGAVQSSTMQEVYLPNSNMFVQFGNVYTFYDLHYAQESQGIKPDIWVESNDAFDYTLRLIQGLRAHE